MKKKIDFLEGPLLKNLIVFMVPIILTNFLQIMFNTADTIVVGRFAGEDALAAVGATGTLVFLLTALFNGLAMGSNVVIAQALGSKDYARIQKSVHTAYTLGAVGGVILFTLGIIFTNPLLKMVSTPSNIIDLSAVYMKYYFSGSVFLLVYNMGASILRAKGDTKRPLYYLGFSGILNLLLNLLFVIVFRMSVVGVALGTVISQAMSAVLVTIALIKDTDDTHLSFKKLGLDAKMTGTILKVGIPTGFQSMMFSISNVVVQSSINSFNSSTIIAGNTIAGNLEKLCNSGMQGVHQSCMTFTSQNYGAKNYKRLSKIVWTSFYLAILVPLAFSSVMYFGRNPLIHLFNDDALVFEVATKRLLFVVMPLFLNAILDIFAAALRGMSFSTLPTAIMLFGICGVRLIYIYTAFPIFNTIESIYWCYPLSWAVASVMMYIAWHIVHKKVIAKAKEAGEYQD